ncbi:MAG TPA: hypothetical protein VFK13_01770 [Gemmatimonadaceae bacterium]|nr:hypothetical protein [Gemmatimonadaceae bacterium]
MMVCCPLLPARAWAQRWNDPQTLALVQRATERRTLQLADTGLADYTATAHGFLTFLAQVGEGFPEPPKVVRADQLALQVYWRAPGLSKQRIIGRRDTLLLPTDIQYHRDHLGILQNNLPDVIRIGEGDEVRDVPHPLSAAGHSLYDFALADSLRITLPTRDVEVYVVHFRPRDDTQPRVLGALYIDRETAQVVRVAVTFTRAAFIDRDLDDLSVVLENALVEGRFWLPYRQEVEIRRRGTWLDLPVRGIIRGRWEICCYEVNRGLPLALFTGPEIVSAPAQELAQYRWEGRLVDVLPPDVQQASDADVRRVQAQARELVRAEALRRSSGATIGGRQVSDFVRVNRVEGLALGAGTRLRLGHGVSAQAAGRWGLDDHAAKGRVSVGVDWQNGSSLRLFAERTYRDAGIVAERALLTNSIAAQEFGSDDTDPYDVRAAGVVAELGTHAGLEWQVEGAVETQDRLSVHATPAIGAFAGTIPAWSVQGTRLALSVSRGERPLAWGATLGLHATVAAQHFRGRDTTLDGHPTLVRGTLDARLERPVGDGALVWRTIVGAVGGTSEVPPQSYVFLGGPVSAPGFDFHAFAAQVALSQRVEWQLPIPFPSVPLGAYGKSPATASLVPSFTAVYARHPSPFGDGREGWYPAVGMGLRFLFGVVRTDVARGLRDGRWTFSIDVSRDFWGVL